MKVLSVLLLGVVCAALIARSEAQVKLSFPPWKDMLCNFVNPGPINSPDEICTLSSDGSTIVFSYDNDVLSTRYQYKKPVRFYKKGTKVATSFSSSFVINIRRDIERSVARVFGGGIALAITPDPQPGNAGVGSIALFPIDTATGNPLSSTSPQTVAVELDTSVDGFDWDGQRIPHLGVDVNSLRSVKQRYLWNQTNFVRRKIGYFVDYDAVKERIEVRVQNITADGKLNKAKSKSWLTYSPLKLSDHVNEYSYVGFSTRVPTTDDGTYDLSAWNFETREVVTKKKQ